MDDIENIGSSMSNLIYGKNNNSISMNIEKNALYAYNIWKIMV